MKHHAALIAALLAGAAPAHANPTRVAAIAPRPTMEPLAAPERVPPHDRGFAAIHVTRPDDPRVELARAEPEVREVGDFALVTIRVTASSNADLWHGTDMQISVPRAARVVGLVLEHDGQREQGQSLVATTATDRFIADTRVTNDPALLELEAHGRDYDRLRLALYPISREQHPTAALTIAIPRVDLLVVDVAGQRHEYHRGTADRPTRADLALLATPPVSETRSFYAAPAPAAPSAAEIRNLVRTHETALAGCNLDGGAVDAAVHFTIQTDGHVMVHSVDHAPVDVAACVSRTLAAVQLHATPAPVAIRYPIHLE